MQAQTLVFHSTQVGTVIALQATVDRQPIIATQLAQVEQENMALQSTVEAVTTLGIAYEPQFTATPQITNTPLNTSRYTEVITTPTIDEETGCATGKNGRFGVEEDAIYLTTKAFDIPANTAHHTEWFFEGDLRYRSDTWIADQNYNEICIYFWIEPADTPFDPGLWAVQFFIDDERYIDVPFEICEPGELC